MQNRQDLIYAVAVREEGRLLLVIRIRRSRDGSVYVLWQRDSDWNPHTTYHRSGQYWQRTYQNRKVDAQRRQPLDSSFRGSEMVISTFIDPIEKEVDPDEFADVFEISESDSRRLRSSRSNCLDVHVVQDTHPLTELKGSLPGVPILKQKTYGDGTPWIVVTLWEPPSLSATSSKSPGRGTTMTTGTRLALLLCLLLSGTILGYYGAWRSHQIWKRVSGQSVVFTTY